MRRSRKNRLAPVTLEWPGLTNGKTRNARRRTFGSLMKDSMSNDLGPYFVRPRTRTDFHTTSNEVSHFLPLPRENSECRLTNHRERAGVREQVFVQRRFNNSCPHPNPLPVVDLTEWFVGFGEWGPEEVPYE
jgi:hypothetical protein